MPLGLVLVVVFALAGASVARRRGWPALLGAVAAGLLPPVGLVACAVFLADRLRDAVAAQTGQTGQTGVTSPPRPELGGSRPRPAGPRREPAPRPLPEALAEGTVLRALRSHGPMSEPELFAALVDPPTEVRYQLRELDRHAAITQRHGKWAAR